jgi:putative hydrolase of the HAD superfamily
MRSSTWWASSVAVEAVIFDWGGTLTPWRTIDPVHEWRALAEVAAPERVDDATNALLEAATTVWTRSRDVHSSSTIEEICSLAGVAYDDGHWAGYRAFWNHATTADPEAAEVLGLLRRAGIRIGVLSNTVWPRAWHEEIFRRDGLDHLIDAAVYTSEIPWTKPAPEAFLTAMQAVGVAQPDACVFVGDRLFDDIYGARNAGMRAVHLPHSDIPVTQVGHTRGEPDAVIQRLSDLPSVIEPWR